MSQAAQNDQPMDNVAEDSNQKVRRRGSRQKQTLEKRQTPCVSYRKVATSLAVQPVTAHAASEEDIADIDSGLSTARQRRTRRGE